MTHADAHDDLVALKQLNMDFVLADQNGDVKWFEENLAADFRASLPDLVLRGKKEFVELMSQPNLVSDMQAHEVLFRLLGDLAIVHARLTFKTVDGKLKNARYTTDYQRREDKWLCISTNMMLEMVS